MVATEGVTGISVTLFLSHGSYHMKLGIRCWPDKFAFVVLDGTGAEPKLVEYDVRKIPSDLPRPGFLDWISKEVKGILNRRHINEAAYKKIEPSAQKNASL